MRARLAARLARREHASGGRLASWPSIIQRDGRPHGYRR
jgi:hypothetical protein